MAAAYWCHSCDMSIALPPSPTPNSLLCPHCHFDSLEQLDLSISLSAAAPKSSIDSLLEIVVKIDDPNVTCPICKDPFVLDSVAKVMPCVHRFHSDCIVPWLEINNSCPVCRFKLPVSVVVDEENNNNNFNRLLSVEFPSPNWSYEEEDWEFDLLPGRF